MAQKIEYLLLCAFFTIALSSIEQVFGAGHGEACDDTKNICDSSKYLVCDSETNKCGCKDSTKEFPEDGVCVLRAGETCISDPKEQQCQVWADCDKSKCTCIMNLVPNAEKMCVHKYKGYCGGGIPGDCDALQFHECIGRSCECQEGTRMHANGKCVSTLGSSCVSPAHPVCDSFMVCSDGKCGCDSTLGVENNGNGKCRKLHGATCDSGNDIHGMCDNEDGFLICQGSKCVCDSKHSEKEQGRDKPCVGDLGADCNSNDNCNPDKELFCKKSEGVCRNGSGRLDFTLEFILGATLLMMLLKHMKY